VTSTSRALVLSFAPQTTLDDANVENKHGGQSAAMLNLLQTIVEQVRARRRGR
jgi:hypothetical protein